MGSAAGGVTGMAGNLATSLKRRGRGRGMDRYDRMPPELRRWLAHAALPWSPASALRLWRRLQRDCGGDAEAMRRRLDLAEARLLARDAPKIWGPAYPQEGRGA